MLIDKYKELTNQAPEGIPKAVENYYSLLAKFTWDCVARTIPLILSVDTVQFDGEIHETVDDDDDDTEAGDDNKRKYVAYIYPVLFTSNSWPREVALKGKVKISEGTIV